MRLRDYVELARERILVVIAVIAVTVVAVVGLLLLQSPSYTASTRLRARPPAPGSAVNAIAVEQQQQTDLGTEAELVRSSQVATEVAKALNLPGKPDDLLAMIKTTPLGTTAVLRIDAEARTSKEAIELANAFAQKYLDVRRKNLSADLDADAQQQSTALKVQLDRLQKIDQVLSASASGSAQAEAAKAERDQIVADLTVSRARLDALANRAAVAAGFGEVIQPATEAKATRSQSLPRAAVFGLLLGIPLALAAVLVLDGLSNDVRSRQDAERLGRTELLGVIPLDLDWHDPAEARLVTSTHPFSPAAEAYRSLSFTLARCMDLAGATSVLVTSPGDGDGKTATVANLAVAAAETGRAIRVVEADLRHPRLHSFFGARSAPGVVDLLAGEVRAEEALVELAFGLQLLPAGRPSERPDLLMARGDLTPVLNGLAPQPARPLKARDGGRQPLVIVDSSSILDAAEVTRLAAQADAVILVVRARTTSKQALSAAAEQVRRVGGSLLGIVLIGVRSIAESGAGNEAGNEARIAAGAQPESSSAGYGQP